MFANYTRMKVAVRTILNRARGRQHKVEVAMKASGSIVQPFRWFGIGSQWLRDFSLLGIYTWM